MSERLRFIGGVIATAGILTALNGAVEAPKNPTQINDSDNKNTPEYIFPAPCEPRAQSGVIIEFASLMRPEPTPNKYVIDSAKQPDPTIDPNKIITECIIINPKPTS